MDVDGDGRVLYMRQADPNGPWKCHPEEPKLLVRRAPDDFEGNFYRLYREGELSEYDGVMVTHTAPREGLDLNRNFPANWAPEGQQMGAGPAPFSEPETRALGDFITTHGNIVSAVSGHTFSGVLLRASSNAPDDDLPINDLRAYKSVGAKGEELTGYPAISIYHDFRYHPKQNITGGFPLRIASNRNIVEYLAMIGFYGLPLDYLDRFVERVNSVTRAQIHDAFQRRLDLQRLVTVVVGDGEAPQPEG